MQQTIRIAIAALMLSILGACAHHHEPTPTCGGGKSCVPMRR
jgi:hypothetical protein